MTSRVKKEQDKVFYGVMYVLMAILLSRGRPKYTFRGSRPPKKLTTFVALMSCSILYTVSQRCGGRYTGMAQCHDR